MTQNNSIDPSVENLTNNDLIIFEENLTAEGLQKISEEAENFPLEATDKASYTVITDHHKRFKRLHVAVRKKADELKKTEKINFDKAKGKIENDLEIVLGVLTPVVDKLANARQAWDDAIKEKKEAAAKIEAEKQKAEQERQQKIVDEFEAHEMNLIIDEKIRLKKEQEKLDREKHEFNCTKTRLNKDEAWKDFEKTMNIKSQIDIYVEEKQTRLAIDGEVFERLNEDESKEFIEPERVTTVTNGTNCGPTDIIGIPEPELDAAMDNQSQRAIWIKDTAISLKSFISSELLQGFESQKITDYLYTFNQSLINFIDHFPEFEQKD